MGSPDSTADADVARRIKRMQVSDQAGLIVFTLGLWATLAFVLFTIWPYIYVSEIQLILAVSCLLVLAFNTASVVVMLRHYRANKQAIYSLDIRHLDEIRARRR